MNFFSKEYALFRSLFNDFNKWPTVIFGLIFGLSIVTGLFVVRENIFSERAFSELERENIAGMILLTNAENNFWQIRIGSSRYSKADEFEQREIKQDFKNSLNALQLNLAETKKWMVYEREKELFTTLDGRLSRFLEIRSKFLNLIDEGRDVEAKSYRISVMNEAEKTTKILHALIENQQVEAVERSAEVALRVQKTRIMMFAYLFLEIALSLGLFKSIAHSQNRLEKNIQVMNHNSKMASLGEMSSNIAHEINNPLTIITGKSSRLIKLVSEGNISQEVFRDNLERILASSDRIVKIVKGMKSISRNTVNDPCSLVPLINLNDNIQSICDGRFRESGIELKTGPIPNVSIECRSTEIEQVIFNLLNNAFDAVKPLSEQWISLDYQKIGDKMLISVTDSGRGIAPDVVKKLMFPFFTTKEIGKGTGLGLSISKRIIEAHQGQLYYDTNSTNTRFIIEMPLKQSPAKSTLKAA